MRVILENRGQAFDLNGQVIGRGGEATVYAMPPLAETALVAKIYHKPTPRHADKLAAMIANPPADPMAGTGHVSIAWPLDRVVAEADRSCLGYIMPRVDRARAIFDFYNPRSRLQLCPLFHYGYLLRTARNLAAAARAIHERGYVIGDVNESNILVTNTALVTLVDTDSFQVPVQGQIHRCPVGKPEYTPPELQGVNFPDVDRAPEHDAFALGVLIFQLLMQGTHPFAGRFTGQGDPEALNKRISSGSWPYARKTQVSYQPTPHAPPFAVLPAAIQELMQVCFEEGHQRPQARPTAAQWQEVLKKAEEELTPCATNPQHLFHRALKECPWCDLARRQGRDPFPERDSVVLHGSGALPARLASPTPGSPSRTSPVSAPRAVRAAAAVAPAPAPARPQPRTTVVQKTRTKRHVQPAQPSSTWIWITAGGTGVAVLLVAIIVVVVIAVSSGSDPQKSPADANPSGKDNKGLIDRFREGAKGAVPPVIGDVVDPPPGSIGNANKVVFTPDCKRALVAGSELVLWNVETNKVIRRMKTSAAGAAFSPDGRRAASSGNFGDATVRLWDLETGQELRVFTGHSFAVHDVAFSPDGKHLLSGGRDGSVRYWEVETGKEVHKFAFFGPATTVAISPDGRYGVAGGFHGNVEAFDLADGKPLRKLGGHHFQLNRLVFLADGRQLLSGSNDKTMRLWDFETGKEVRKFEDPANQVTVVAVSPDGKRFLSGNDNGIVRLWNLETGDRIAEYSPGGKDVRGLAFSADGRTFYMAAIDKLFVQGKLP